MRTIKLLTLAVLLGTLVSCEDDYDSSVKEDNILNLITKTYHLESYYEDTMVFDRTTEQTSGGYTITSNSISLGRKTLYSSSSHIPVKIVDTLRIDLTTFNPTLYNLTSLNLGGERVGNGGYNTIRINHLEILGLENHPNLRIYNKSMISSYKPLKISTSNISRGKLEGDIEYKDMTKDQRSFEITFNADISTNTEEGIYKKPFGPTYEEFFFSSVGDIGLIHKHETEGGLTYGRKFKYQVKEIYY